MDLIDKIQDLGNFGINLKIKDYYCQEFYCESLKRWLEEEKGYQAYSTGEMRFIVERQVIGLLTVYILDGILRFELAEGDPYDVLMDVLDFVAKKHRDTINVFNYLSESGNSVEDWFSGKPLKNSAAMEEESFEEDSEESSEWL